LAQDHAVRIVIFSDSQAALRLVGWSAVGKGGAYWSAVVAAHRMQLALAEVNATVVWEWIPGHVGLWQNECADKGATTAAKECQDLRVLAESIPRPHALLRGYVRASIKWQMDKWWAAATTDVDRGKMLFGDSRPPPIREILKEARMSRAVEVCITKLRTGGETRPHARARMGLVKAGDESCPMCKAEHDGTEHALLRCPYYADGREVLKGVLLLLDSDYHLSIPMLVGLVGVKKDHRVAVWQSFGKFLLHKGLGQRLTETRRRVRVRGQAAANTA
jgi:hypothetical protein